MRWLANQTRINPSEVTVRDILPFEVEHAVQFISCSHNVFDVEEIFNREIKAQRKLEALIVTQTDEVNAPPVGIITSWELIKVN